MSFANVLYTIIIYPLVQIIELVFFLFNKLFDSVGIATIGVSLCVTLLCLPLYVVAEGWQDVERKIQSRLAPQIARIKACFKGDEQYMILSTFYRQNHYHPIMALRSSFGLLIQIPFFMAAYSCLSNMEALQGAHFAFIRDMGAPDALFSIFGFSLNVLPIAMTAINCVSGAIYSKGHLFREKIQICAMALIFLVLLYDSPAGLVLYWTMNNVFSLIKNIFYKMKNPLKVLYACMCVAVISLVVFILFIYGGSVGVKRRVGAAAVLLSFLPIPFYVKFAGFLLKNPLHELMLNRRVRFYIFALASISLCVFLGLVLPSEMFASSVQEFSDIDGFASPNQFLRFPFLQSTGIFIFWSWCVFFLFKENVQSLLSCLFSCMLFCAIVNAYAFAGDYGSMDASLKFLDGFRQQGTVFLLANLISIFAICIAAILAFRFRKEKFVLALCAISLLVFSMISVANVSKISREYAKFEQIALRNAVGNSMDVKFHLSKNGKNVIVMMLDRCEAAFFEPILRDFPALQDSFADFTFYKNTVSFNGHTLIGSPPLYGGYDYTPENMNARMDVPLKQKHNESLSVLARVFTEQADFVATLSDLSWANYSYVSDMSFLEEFGNGNISGISLNGRYNSKFKQEFGDGSKMTLSQGLERNVLWVSIFRTIPAVFRSPIYYRGSYLNANAIDGAERFLDWYAPLYYLPQITSFDSEQNSFVMMTNEATHFGGSISSLNIIERSSLSYADSDNYVNCAATLLAVGRWLDFLKENDCYENTRIIIVADHGIGATEANKLFGGESSLDGYAKDHLYPILLVKQFYPLVNDVLEFDNEHIDASLMDKNFKNVRVGVSMEFMTNADTPSLALEGIVANPKNPYTGNSIDMLSKSDGALVVTDSFSHPDESRSKNIFTVDKQSLWRVRENIFDPKNWVKE